jgi:hypothetical protein
LAVSTVTPYVAPISPILSTMIEAVLSSARATQRHMPEDGILHNHCRENFESCTDIRT